ncbi:hypothetical protein D3C87_2015020 [compost metagenome]
MITIFSEICGKLNVIAFYIFNGIIAVITQPVVHTLAFQIGRPQLILVYFPADVMVF